MATGTAGTTARQLPYQVVHFLRKSITYASPGSGVAATVGILPAGAVIVKPMSGVHITTAFNDSGTDLLDIGTSANDDLFATDLDLSSATFLACDEAVGDFGPLAADTTITATYTGQNANASAGAAEIIICYIPDTDG